MIIKKIDPIYPSQLSTIPKEHWKWCGHNKKKEVKILNGDLILYDKCGNIVIHKSDEKENSNG